MYDITLLRNMKMTKIILLFLSSILLINCNNPQGKAGVDNRWSDAVWIGYKKLEDSQKLVPGTDKLHRIKEGKESKRSVVPLFRKTFTVDKSLKKAVVNISGLGHYELYINGEKVGDSFLAPGWTMYQKRALYNTFNITEFITKGQNAIGAIVGNGFFNISSERYRKLEIAYGYPKLIFNITLTYSDGTVQNIVSDSSCKTSPSPISFSSIYGGENYDARLEQPGWSRADFNNDTWSNAMIIDTSTSMLFPEKDFPLKVMQEFEVKRIMKSKTGKTVYDFGQNASGIISLKVKGNRGAHIRIRPDELINEEGDVTQRSGGGSYEFNYILKGEGIEEWQPRFTYYGFRYAEVEITEPDDAKNRTEIVELKMLHTRNSSPIVGSFSCSDTLFNQTFDLINWAIRSNMASVLTDCPHREKLGWLEQTYLMGPSIHYNYDIRTLYNKIVDDMIDSQLEDGLVPDIAPEYVPFHKDFRDSPEWGSATVIIPWLLYRWYGDEEVLKRAYPMMKRYVNYLQSKSTNSILTHGLGDWFDLGPKRPGYAQLTPRALTATSIYFYDLQILTKIAGMHGYESDLQRYSSLLEDVRNAFLKEFYNSATGVVSTGSQTAYAMSLYTGLIPDAGRQKVFDNLVKSIQESDYALTSGDIGYHFLVRVLSENGRSDILFRMNNRTDRPGYGFQLKKGATSLTESWSALTNVSNNHLMLGHLMEWFYTGLGGIYQDENSVAYDRIIIAPKPVGNIKWVNCSFNSPKGVISSQWRIEGESFKMDVEIPENSNTEVIIPNDFKNRHCKVMNSLTKDDVEVTITNGTFNLKPGKYSVVFD